MAIFKLYSKRQKGEVPEVFTYDNLPSGLRVQASLIIDDAFGVDKRGYGSDNEPEKGFAKIHEILCREYGIFELGINNTGYALTGREQLKN